MKPYIDSLGSDERCSNCFANRFTYGSSNSSNSRAPLVRDETDALALSKFPANEPSLCIPWVYSNITKERVLETIEAIGLGELDRIDATGRVCC